MCASMWVLVFVCACSRGCRAQQLAPALGIRKIYTELPFLSLTIIGNLDSVFASQSFGFITGIFISSLALRAVKKEKKQMRP